MITTFQVFLRTRDPHGRPQKSLRRRQELEIIKGRMYRVRRSVGVRWSMVWGGTLYPLAVCGSRTMPPK